MLQAAHDLVQRLQGAGHLQADQVAADALDQGWRPVRVARSCPAPLGQLATDGVV